MECTSNCRSVLLECEVLFISQLQVQPPQMLKLLIRMAASAVSPSASMLLLLKRNEHRRTRTKTRQMLDVARKTACHIEVHTSGRLAQVKKSKKNITSGSGPDFKLQNVVKRMMLQSRATDGTDMC